MGRNENMIESANAAIEKFEKKLERINIALAGGKNPYYYSENDLKNTTRDLSDARARLQKYAEKKAIDDSVEHIPVIEEFLEEWKVKADAWYRVDYGKLLAYKKEYNQNVRDFEAYRNAERSNYADNKEWRKAMMDKEEELKIDYKSHREILKLQFNALTLEIYSHGSSWAEKLEHFLEMEKRSKRKYLLERVKAITGEITDAKGIYIGGNGEINGFIMGKNGTAQVRTIGAGGYNIQCFHYRVLVDEYMTPDQKERKPQK